jgi:diamine N-acetyltransferase
MSHVVRLDPISRDNVIAVCRLRVAPEQASFVSPNAESLAEALVRPEAKPLAVMAGDEPVGFAMLFDDGEQATVGLWRFMIDAAHQRKGYGSAAMAEVIAHVRQLRLVQTLFLTAVPEQGGPGPFYERLGFQPTGEVNEHGEAGYRLELSTHA